MTDPGTLKGARIAIVDDEESNVALLEQMLERAGYANLLRTTDSSQAVSLCAEWLPDLLLLDLRMPAPDGFEVMEALTRPAAGAPFPILVLTADTGTETKQRALASGAKDFVTKPFERIEVLLRIENLLETQFLEAELRQRNAALTQAVETPSSHLGEARPGVLERLARAGEYRDDITGQHAQRVGRTAAAIAERLGLPQTTVQMIRNAAPLHDLGKIGTPDQILLKPGELTADELEVMRRHVTIGAEILSDSDSSLLQMAADIALTHHERWDGMGYLAGLKGEEIPLPGRITALADVFDALVHDRPYRRAWSLESALQEVRSQTGTQFDPAVVKAFETLDPAVLMIPVASAGSLTAATR